MSLPLVHVKFRIGIHVKSMWGGGIHAKKKHSIFENNFKKLSIYFLSLKHNKLKYNKQTQLITDAVRVAKAKPPGLQGVQEGDAEVLLQARFNEAHGHPATAGAVFERIHERQKIHEWWMRP